MKRFCAAIALVVVAFTVPRAQMRVVPIDDLHGHVALGLALRHLTNAGIFMMATAHPDDENNGLLVMLNRGHGYRTALATATRGNGGQNEIGPELFEALGVLRTEELGAIHRFDGAEQYFTRAVDFGYSFSVDETMEKWGREEIVGDFVRLIRTIRPDVMTGLTPGGNGGGQHHQASALIAREAFKAAGDPTRYPEQLKDGLHPWQPKKFYYASAVGYQTNATAAANQLTINLTGFDRLLGATYAAIGAEARSMHKCQGTPQLLSLPGPATAGYVLTESSLPASAKGAADKSAEKAETSLFDGIDTSIAGLAQFAGAKPPKELTEALASIANAVQLAQRKFDTDTDDSTVSPLLAGFHALRTTRALVRQLPLTDTARYELDYRLRQKEREFQEAILIASGIQLDAIADDGVVVPGQAVRVSLTVASHGAADVAIKQVRFEGFQGSGSCALTPAVAGRGRGGAPTPTPPAATPASAIHKDQALQCAAAMTVPSDAKFSEPYWHRDGEAGRYTFDADAPFGLPFRPTPFYVQVTFGFAGGEEIFGGVPVSYRYESDIFGGEKRSELLVVPAASVSVSPSVLIAPASQLAPPPPAAAPAGRGTATRPTGTQGRAATPAGRGAAAPATPPAPAFSRDIRVTVVNDVRGPAEESVRLQLPEGWTSNPAEQKVAFTREDESRTLRFQVTPPPSTKVGNYAITAVVAANDNTFARGFEVIEYPHIHRQHIYHAAAATVKVLDVKIAPNLRVGYVMGVGDEVPSALEQLGATVEMIGADDLAWGNLSRFSTIVTGVRAYERRADLRANNSRLLDYVRDGGTLVVQYNKFEFNEAQYGPFAAKVSSDRVTDEHAPVRVLAPTDPIVTTPNKIGPDVWSGWVQERGLYFLGQERDSRYRDIVAMEDPFPNNSGEKRGALVVAQYGKGRWAYIGLGLWRQLPAGTDGAYPLMANIISLNH